MRNLLLLVSLVLALPLALAVAVEVHVRRLAAGAPAAHLALADAVADWALAEAGDHVDSLGDDLIDAEWTFGACTMAVAGLGQVVRAHPETRDRYLPAMDACMDWLLQPTARAFGTRAWGGDGLTESHASPSHAYLGYLGVAMGIYRRVEPDPAWAPVHDRLVASFRRGLASPPHAFQTYPGETYAADLAMVLGTLGAHPVGSTPAQARQVQAWLLAFREEAVDPETGLVYQFLSPRTGRPRGSPRGSGTALAVYGFSFVDADLSRDLMDALREEAWAPVGPLGAVREYPRGTDGPGDVDSGPVILGRGVSPTGFALSGARIHGDGPRFRALARTATMFGLPLPMRGGLWHVTGGGLGNAILLAMITAGP